jgi:defect-in-organelle-trafficking protein DotD
MKKIFAIIACVIFLSSCVSEHRPPEPNPGDASSIKLAEAAVAADSSLQTLEAIRKAEIPNYDKKLPNPANYRMNALASVDWTGPIGPFVQSLADASGYRVRILGNPPAIPVIVSLNEKNKSLAEMLRDADFQAGDKAQIIVYPANQVIELRYNKF